LEEIAFELQIEEWIVICPENPEERNGPGERMV
jgi:hypothetical protein